MGIQVRFGISESVSTNTFELGRDLHLKHSALSVSTKPCLMDDTSLLAIFF